MGIVIMITIVLVRWFVEKMVEVEVLTVNGDIMMNAAENQVGPIVHHKNLMYNGILGQKK